MIRNLAVFTSALLWLLLASSATAAAEGYRVPPAGALVRLVPIEAGASDNQHPRGVSAETLSRFLASLRVPGGKLGEPLFTAAEQEILAPHLAQALGTARPDQDVVFVVQDFHGKVPLFQGKTASAGRLFVADGRLNLIMGRAHYPAEQETKALGWERPLEPGRRSGAPGEVRLVMFDFNAPLVQPRPDWLAVPLDQLTALPAVAPNPDDVARPLPAARTRLQEVESRLEVLEGLRHKGLIAEEEYRAARREILLQR